MSKINSVDEQLVQLLGHNARQNSEALAKQLKLSPATIRRRMRSLLHNDILHIVGVVDPAKFGLPVTAVFCLDIDSDRLEKAIEGLAQMPEIRWMSITAGRFDIVATALFPSTGHLSEFIKNKLGKMEDIKDSETLVCLEVRKGHYTSLGQIDINQ